MSEKNVLVVFGKRLQPISFFEGDDEPGKVLQKARLEFCNVLSGEEELFLQIKDEDWDGMFVDTRPGQILPDKSVLKLEEVHIVYCKYFVY